MQIQEYIPLAGMTTMKIGGSARYFCEVQTLEDLKDALHFVQKKKLPLFILGGGSNLLMSDHGYPGLVMRVRILGCSIEDQGDTLSLTAGSGEVWDDIVLRAVDSGFSGLENLSLIPGTVGGALVQNIGAYGSEVKDYLDWVEVYDPDTQTLRTLTKEECQFGYRDSIWKHAGKQWIIARVQFRLTKNVVPNITYKDLAHFFERTGNTTPSVGEVRAAVILIRTAKFPDLGVLGTAGSFFKNPVVATSIARDFLARYPDAPHYDLGGGMVKLSAAWIIDHVLHARGVRAKNVGCWDAQALVVVNYGNASYDEVTAFVRDIQKRVHDACMITLEPEVLLVDE